MGGGRRPSAARAALCRRSQSAAGSVGGLAYRQSSLACATSDRRSRPPQVTENVTGGLPPEVVHGSGLLGHAATGGPRPRPPGRRGGRRVRHAEARWPRRRPARLRATVSWAGPPPRWIPSVLAVPASWVAEPHAPPPTRPPPNAGGPATGPPPRVAVRTAPAGGARRARADRACPTGGGARWAGCCSGGGACAAALRGPLPRLVRCSPPPSARGPPQQAGCAPREPAAKRRGAREHRLSGRTPLRFHGRWRVAVGALGVKRARSVVLCGWLRPLCLTPAFVPRAQNAPLYRQPATRRGPARPARPAGDPLPLFVREKTSKS